MEAIVLAGFSAVGKTTAAKIIAEKLHLPVVGGGDILREMAIDRGYDPKGEDWWDTEDGIKFAKERDTNPDFDKEADERLAKKIAKGDIVVTSYTAPWISNKGFKVWLSGSIESRASRMLDRDKTTLEECIKVIKIRDQENVGLYKKLYGIDFGNDLKPFHIVIDTNDKTPDEVAEIIIKAVLQRQTG
ncbi:MAG: cytidylate kinase family protein [Candidatus Marsarchaeota archaeon]|jgi:cytidylate kinase|nr:cytidylate kinase family protein [Candidatus Marsarchaeota archaeon]